MGSGQTACRRTRNIVRLKGYDLKLEPIGEEIGHGCSYLGSSLPGGAGSTRRPCLKEHEEGYRRLPSSIKCTNCARGCPVAFDCKIGAELG